MVKRRLCPWRWFRFPCFKHMCLALEYVVTGGDALLSRVDGNEDLQLLTTRGISVFRHKRRNSKKKLQ